ncbi:unnamed protein product [Pleuronectes platessa]|uniref:Uncharacterized protein n=1 Tax=Pleuronectes platessa TaxID=8262 RepID=A0A9N7YBL9_PLEPL|nr:unnamed protein product [Pleuronectes platessa]
MFFKRYLNKLINGDACGGRGRTTLVSNRPILLQLRVRTIFKLTKTWRTVCHRAPGVKNYLGKRVHPPVAWFEQVRASSSFLA